MVFKTGAKVKLYFESENFCAKKNFQIAVCLVFVFLIAEISG